MRKLVLVMILTSITFISFSQVSLIKYDQLETIVDQSESRLTIINFWATWCAPCIKELPYFEEADKLANVNVILVSLDFPEEHIKVEQFVKKKQLSSKVYHLNEKDHDSYMGKVNESWSGAIPATLMIYQEGGQSFYEKAFTREFLFKEINRYIN